MDDMLQNAFLRMMTGNVGQKKSRQELIADHEKKLKSLEQKFNSSNSLHTINTTNNQGYKGISQKVQLVTKNRISLSDLELDKVHSGKFLLCRVIIKSVKMT